LDFDVNLEDLDWDLTELGHGSDVSWNWMFGCFVALIGNYQLLSGLTERQVRLLSTLLTPW